MLTMRQFQFATALLALSCSAIVAFVPHLPAPMRTPTTVTTAPTRCANPRPQTTLHMGLDLVTYLRTEWISAALCTNQTPRIANVCLQLGCQDGRAVTFIPRTIRRLITSTVEADGVMPISVRRQLKQQQERRGAARVEYMDQRADDLSQIEDESIDVVISLQAAAPMMENGLDWKKSIRESARVLRPGGRLLFVEQSDLNGESYLDYVDNLGTRSKDGEIVDEEEENRLPMFEVGYDDVGLVLVPHVAGVAVKLEDAGLTAEERAAKQSQMERDRIADLSISAYERGIKKRKRKKKKGIAEDVEASK